jgi:plasmid stabilization system protein ParE
MSEILNVIWTRRALKNALAIKVYLELNFTKKEVTKFERLLRQFERTVSYFPTLYPESATQNLLRRAVIHKNTTVFYIYDQKRVIVIAMKDNRQNEAGADY